MSPHAVGAGDAGGSDVLIAPADVETRILEAASRCVSRWGMAKTTLDDIAREAACSRATVYRVVPGGRQAVLLAAAERRIEALLADLRRSAGEADDLTGALVELVCGAAQAILGDDALGYLMVHEPAVVLPHVSFDRLEPLLARVADETAPVLTRFVGLDEARATVEWVARVVVAYVFDRDHPLDLRDRAATRRFLETYVLPGISTS